MTQISQGLKSSGSEARSGLVCHRLYMHLWLRTDTRSIIFASFHTIPFCCLILTFSGQYFIMKKFEHTAKLKEVYSEYL